MFGPVDLGAPAVCAEYLSAHGGCAISSAMGVGGVLLIGAATGYSTALLAEMGAQVTAVEEEGGPEIAVPGVTLVRGALAAGAPDGAPYDILFIDGAVEEVPAALVQQLADGARVVTGIIDRGVTRLCAGRTVGGALGLGSLADIEMVALPGFGAAKTFTF